MSSPVARERWAMAPRVCRRAALVDGVGRRGLGGELDHVLETDLVGRPTFRVVPLQEAGLLAAVVAGAVQGLEELSEGQTSPVELA